MKITTIGLLACFLVAWTYMNQLGLRNIPVHSPTGLPAKRPPSWGGLLYGAAAVGTLVVLLAILASFFLPSSPVAQPDGAVRVKAPQRSVAAHVTVPPGGRWVRAGLTLQTDALLADPVPASRTLVAGTTDGLWLSSNVGATWRRAGHGIAGVEVLALARRPGSASIFAGTATGAVYVSTSASRDDWRRVSPMFVQGSIFSLAVSPEGDQTVLAGTSGALYLGQPAGRTWHWQQVARTDQSSITAIAWSSVSPHRVVASVFGATPPVLSSNDGGLHWHADAAGLPSVLPSQAMLITGVGTPTLMLSTMGDGVWQRSGDGAWHDISAGLPLRHAMPLAGNATTVYAGTMGYGVYVRQGAGNWRRLSPGLDGATYTALSLLVVPAIHPVLLVGTADGLYRYVYPGSAGP